VKKKIGLILTGGGARASYQVGALKGIQEIAKKHNLPLNISIIVGSSAGSINATYLASHMDQPNWNIDELATLWNTLKTEKIYDVAFWALVGKALRGVFELSSGDFVEKKQMKALLDNAPLKQFLSKSIPFDRIQKNIDAQHLDALAIKTINYSTGTANTFFQGNPSLEGWNRSGRLGLPDNIHIGHIMASTALPVLFPPEKIGDYEFGDGSMRNHTPLSSAIKLGADKLLIIGVKQKQPKQVVKETSLSRMMGLVLNTLLLDAIDLDYERLIQVNKMVKMLTDSNLESPYRQVDPYILRPSDDIGEIAMEYQSEIPKTVRHFIQGLGRKQESSDLCSYLLFEAPFTTKLYELGYKDALEDEENIKTFLVED